MFFNEHQPPHFHAVYGEYRLAIAIDTLALLMGHIPPRPLGLVIEWASLHQEELNVVWNQAARREKPDTIEPLP